MSLRMQAMFLRFSKTARSSRWAPTGPEHLDVRVIAATNKDLAAALAAGQFREDLMYRLDVVHIRVPRSANGPRTSGRSSSITSPTRAGGST